MADLRQTEKYADYMRSIGWTVERINKVNYFFRSFWIFGSFMKLQRPEKINIKEIDMLQKKHKVFQALIEPLSDQQAKENLPPKYKKINSPYLPSKTILIDLTKTEKQLLAEMQQKTRYNIRHSIKLGVETKTSQDIDAFVKLWKNAKFSRKIMSAKDISQLYMAFGKDAHLLLAYKDERLLAGVVCVHADKYAYYMYAATTEEGRKLYAPTLLVWEHLKLGKKLKMKIFDFEGIYDDRFPIESWKGFSRFKKGFGGKEKIYPGGFRK